MLTALVALLVAGLLVGLLFRDDQPRRHLDPAVLRIDVIRLRNLSTLPDIVRAPSVLEHLDAYRVDPEFGTLISPDRPLSAYVWVAREDARTRRCQRARRIAADDGRVDVLDRWRVFRACSIGR